MKDIILYLLKSGLWIGVFGMVYWLFLRKETFYKFNRFFLIFGLFASFLLPLCVYRYTIKLDITPFISSSPAVALPETSGLTISPWTILIVLHIIGAFFLLIRQLKGILKLKNLIARNGFRKESGTKIVHTKDVNATFSIFNYIFIDSSSSISEVERKMIYEHERAHINQYHWVDLAIIHTACIFQWFNPFVWMYLNSIKQNHEFLADQEVLKNGNSPAVYRAALINYTLKTPVFAFANAFAQYNKFKRIDMMKKENSNPKKRLAVLLLVPAFVAFLWFFAEPEYVFANNDKVQQINLDFVINSELNNATKDSVKTIQKFIIIKSDTKDEKASVSENVSMQDINIVKDSVIVVGYGTQKKKEFSTSLVHLSDTLGLVGKTAQIHVRGLDLNDVNGDKPLFIVDGKVISEYSFHKLDPDQIESISVLKDLASSQIYGNKNGTIVVTTKRSNPATNIISFSADAITVTTDKITKNAEEPRQITFKIENDLRPSSSSSNPLIVIDGVVSEKGIESVNPENVESMEILKDASSTSTYGEMGKNGVILITTKKVKNK